MSVSLNHVGQHAKGGRVHCGMRWTTGTGPDDQQDTGVHVCALPPDTRHGFSHICRCGMQKPAASTLAEPVGNQSQEQQ